jgi:CheY-like chemotaxis protein
MTPSSATPRRVLIVDDDIDIREALAEALSDEGYETRMAANGRDALQLLRSDATSRESVILLDLMMPILDGYGFLEAQREDPQLAAIPVAIITAGASPDRARLGSAPILTKPVDMAKLLRVLDGLTPAAPAAAP